MASYQENVLDGNTLGSLRSAILTGSLWAIGSAWALSIREIVVIILPVDVKSIGVFAELSAATITTLVGVAISLLAVRFLRMPVTFAAPDPQPSAREARGYPAQRRFRSGSTL